MAQISTVFRLRSVITKGPNRGGRAIGLAAVPETLIIDANLNPLNEFALCRNPVKAPAGPARILRKLGRSISECTTNFPCGILISALPAIAQAGAGQRFPGAAKAEKNRHA
jgi:hypothetical protein